MGINPNNIDFLNIYGHFLRNIIDDVKEGDKLIEKSNTFAKRQKGLETTNTKMKTKSYTGVKASSSIRT